MTSEERFEHVRTLFSSVYNYAEALSLLQELANEGYAPAQHELGDLYYKGMGGLKEDKARAAEWYCRAAEQGDEQARALFDKIKNTDSRSFCERCYNGEIPPELRRDCEYCTYREKIKLI